MSTLSSSRTYRDHRERQRRRILESAESLFAERGIDRVTMAELAETTGVRISTLYQYFSNKDEVVWALLEGVLRDFAARAEVAVGAETKALGKLTALLELMADDLTAQAGAVRFMAQFDAMYAREWPVERLLEVEEQIGRGAFRWFGELIREGIRDGSLRGDLDPELTMHAVMNAAVGTQRRLGSLGDRVEREYGRPIDSLFREAMRVLLLGLRAD